MKQIDFNQNWKVSYLYVECGSIPEPGYVNLPHDGMIALKRDEKAASGAAGGYYPGCICRYEKEWELTEEVSGAWFLCLEGVMGISKVWCNNQLLAEHVNGYTEYWVELQEVLVHGLNKICIEADMSNVPCSRWYTGCGIYRPVWLYHGEEAYFHPWKVCCETKKVTEQSALLEVRGTIATTNSSPRRAYTVRITLQDEAGKTLIQQEEITTEDGHIAVRMEGPYGRKWSHDDPYLHTLRLELLTGERIADVYEQPIGIRTVMWGQDGLQLNGQPIKLKGGCLHHDNGPMGAVSIKGIERRKIRLLKEIGYNAVRTAHNPFSCAFLQVCDEEGMLVMEEFYDTWNLQKMQYDYHLHFADLFQEDIESVICRDRNHSSIIAWSTGNEIGERDGSHDGYAWAKRLVREARRWDESRILTNGVCAVFEENGKFGGLLGNIFNGSAGSLEDLAISMPDAAQRYVELMERFPVLTEPFCKPLDVVGYNYLEDRYEEHKELFPNRIICGTESYPKTMKAVWDKVVQLPYVIGDFSWTAMDYIGESGIGRALYGTEKLDNLFGTYPCHISGCGDYDLCGNLKPQGYFRKILWGQKQVCFLGICSPKRMTQKEIITPWGWSDLEENWTYPGWEGKPARAVFYTSAPEAELFQNGKSLGRKQGGAGCLEYTWEVPYEAGTLEAKAYDGDASISAILRTAGAPEQVHTYWEELEDSGLRYIFCEVQDAKGTRVATYEDELVVTYKGGKVLSVSNGNPYELYSDRGNRGRCYRGRALIIVEKEGEERLNKLNLILMKEKRYDDVVKTAQDEEHRKQLFTELNIK